MDIEAVDEAIERYVEERMGRGKQRAAERFLGYIHLRYAGGEIRRFLGDVAKISLYYIDYFKVLENPMKGPELPWLASMTAVGIFAIYLLQHPEFRLLGIVIFAGILTSAWTLVRTILQKRRHLEVMIAIYREIHDLAESEAAK